MSFRSLIFILLVGAAFLASQRARTASAEAVHAANRAPAAGTRSAAPGGTALALRRSDRTPPSAGSIAPLTSGTARVRDAVGTAGARVVAPTVVGMASKTENLLTGLEPAVQRAPPIRRQRAERAAKLIRELDTAALAQIEEGRPIAALRSAMRARELLDIVRAQLIEESIR